MYQLKFKHVWIYWTLNSIFGFAFFLFVPAAIIDGFTDWNYFEAVYFSMVTFTTVGFGDIHLPLEVEVEHFYELVVYRVFGLSVVAAIIESVLQYIKFRKRLLLRNKRENLERISMYLQNL